MTADTPQGNRRLSVGQSRLHDPRGLCRVSSNGRSECRPTTPQRIEEVASQRLVEKFSDESDSEGRTNALVLNDDTTDTPTDQPRISVRSDGDRVLLEANGEPFELTATEARTLRETLADAVTDRAEYLHTAGEHRSDGSYAIERRAASSSGHRKVFDSFADLKRLYRELPEEFTATEVGRSGLTGGRRHLVVRHLVEHPEFDCELVSRQPLTVRKLSDAVGTADSSPVRVDGGAHGD